ncbi:hypothetical protein ANAPRD1_01367 [Anaplasma phagocytophilum]|nr:hypothetical protein ANAPRD1_01367 [Anaplasma phagocytophilum]
MEVEAKRKRNTFFSRQRTPKSKREGGGESIIREVTLRRD